MEKRKPYIVKDVKQNRYIVFGTSLINHKIRLELEISNDEYVFLDFLKYMQDQSINKITWGDLWRKIGLDHRDLPPIWRSLKEKGLVYRHESGIVTTSQKWDDMFSAKINFDELWSIYPKGNKQQAREMYKRAIRIQEHTALVEAYKKYVDWCEATDTFRKNTSSWLNPKFRYWEDDLKIDKKDDKSGQQSTTLEEEW